MHEKMKAYLNSISDGTKTDWGETAWPLECVPSVLGLALDNRWIVLGGDVLTMEQNHTYDNWYFNPNPQIPLEDNVKASVVECLQYISQYINRNGKNFLFTFTIADTYIEGKC